ncbi:LysR family transcriptional regulator [Salipiger sp. PrR002]|uniref:LysR family transcriptional regulator n=1 Tax=Salipiger sp. PrR002 TaxID=2706489 RepID=UPI0013BE4DD6|nr:LysR substrate-binding domain-containing protein [Salipiger sp. PrR002]NDW01290.1 LysR family transcriptional regulator [Salipiger sp. PrR002]NDW58066.1 LysR family transcriptional regulator [Salipiger sp. PrR004]
MDLGLLEDFLELARELNFSRAAEKRNMTQPAFSRRIRALEEAVETPLISRTTRQVSLTAAGKVFQPRAEAIVRALWDARAEAKEAAGLAQRSLNLAATHALSYTFVPRWLMSVAGPGQVGTLNLVSDTFRQCVRLMESGDATFFICHKGSGEGLALPEKQFAHHPVGCDRLVPFCAPGETGAPLWTLGAGAEDLPLLSYGPASGLHRILETHWAQHGRPRLKSAMSSVLASTNLEMAKAGQGVAFLPSSLAEAEVAKGALVRAGAAEFEVPLQIVIYRSRSRLSPHCEAFWSTLTCADAA